jgi:hypothetical protein
VSGRRILAIPGVLALVFATTMGVGMMPSGASKPKYPPTTLPRHIYCDRVIGFVRVGGTVQITISGSGFQGRPSVTSNTPGTEAIVIHDHGNVLVVLVSVKNGSRTGSYIFKISNPDHNFCRLYYTAKF